jgi:hypothetical protein
MRFGVAWLLPTVLACTATVAGAQSPGLQTEWSRFVDHRGTTIQYPSSVFSVERGPRGNGTGRVYSTPDGRARIHMYSIPNSRNESPAEFLQSEFPLPRSTLKYDRVTRSFFAVSAVRNGLIVYLRCNFSSNAGGTIHCVDVRYPVQEKQAWDRIVTRISHSVRPL